MSAIPDIEGTVGWRQRLDATLRAAVDAILIIDETGRIELVNPAAEAMFGYERDELVGSNVKVLMPEPWSSGHDQYLRSYLESGEAKIIGTGREVQGKKKDGSTFPIDLSVGEGSYAGQRFFVGIIRDIRRRKKLEGELSEREEELRQTQQNAPIPTATLDLEGRVLSVNPACSAIFGYVETECIGKHFLDICHPEDVDATARLFNSLSARELDSGTLQQKFLAKDRATLHGTLHAGAIHDQEGHTSRFVVQIVDRTQEVEAERTAQLTQERLAHISRVNILGEMAAGIAHEVNQPLGAISNYASACRFMLRGEGTVDVEKLAGILEKISDQAERAGLVIRHLRSLAKRGGSSRDVSDLNDLVADAVGLARAEARLRTLSLRLELDEHRLMAEVDGVQIQQVLLNLLRNAMEASETNTDAEIVVATRLDDGGEIEVAVTDRGRGIDPEVKMEIMRPFVSTKETGMGMGLAICQSIVASHGGRLWFSDNEGPGATFHFTVPAEPAAEQDGRV